WAFFALIQPTQNMGRRFNFLIASPRQTQCVPHTEGSQTIRCELSIRSAPPRGRMVAFGLDEMLETVLMPDARKLRASGVPFVMFSSAGRRQHAANHAKGFSTKKTGERCNRHTTCKEVLFRLCANAEPPASPAGPPPGTSP